MNPYESPRPVDDGPPREWLTLAGACNFSYGCACITTVCFSLVFSFPQYRKPEWWVLLLTFFLATLGYFCLWARFHPAHQRAS